MTRLAGRTAVVIGSTRGIGRAICARLAAEGAATVVTGRNPAAGADAVATIRAAGGRAEFIQLDASDLDAQDRLFDTVRATHGRLDVLVNAAATLRPGPLLDATPDDFDAVFGLNVRALFFAIQRGAREMMPGGGSIVTIGSTSATRASRDRALYCGSKAALRQLTRAAALELAGSGVRVNMVSPGAIDTEMLREVFGDRADLDQVVADFAAKRVPLARMGTALEVAAAVAFLASDEASWVTGADLPASGGLHLT